MGWFKSKESKIAKLEAELILAQSEAEISRQYEASNALGVKYLAETLAKPELIKLKIKKLRESV